MKKRNYEVKESQELTDDPATKERRETEARRDLVFLKVDPKGQLVDMRAMPRKELQALLIFYEGKLRRARHKDMKRAYDQCVQQISAFICGENVPWPPDVFALCKHSGVKDANEFIRTYLAHLPVTTEESVNEYLLQYHRARKVPFTGWSIPPDEVIAKMCEAILGEEPPSVEVSARLFTEYYEVAPVNVKFSSLEGVSFYDARDNTIYINPGKVQEELEILERLVEALFDHISEQKSWRFDDNAEVSMAKQTEQQDGFTWAFLKRCFETDPVE